MWYVGESSAPYLLQMSQPEMNRGAHHGAQVGGAGADVAQAVVTHQSVTLSLHQLLYL